MTERVLNTIKEKRKHAGLTQEELGVKVGVSRQTIISIERGRYIPSLPLALKVAKYFQCPVDEIFELDEF